MTLVRSRWLAQSRQSTNNVATIAGREWRTSVFTKVFAIVGLAYPLLISAILWLGVLGLLLVKLFGGFGEIPQTMKLIEQILGANQGSVPSKYYVIDNSESKFGDTVRSEILKRDVSLVMDFLRGKTIEDYVQQLPSMNPYATAEVAEELVSLQDKFQEQEHTFDSNSAVVSTLVDAINDLQQLVDAVNVNVDDLALRSLWYSGDKFTREIEYVAMWWVENSELLAQVVPNVSSRYFKELSNRDLSLAELNALVVANVIEGYFILPTAFPDERAQIHFVTEELTDSKAQRTTLLLKIWYEEVVQQVLASESSESLDSVTIDSLVPIFAKTVHVSDKTDADGLVENNSLETMQRPRYLNLWVRSIWMTTFLITMFYSVYAMSFNTTEEKQNRIAEVLLSNVSSFNLLDGKVWGNTLIILTVCLSWFVILGLPLMWMIYLAPELGSDALRELFNPIYILNWFLFLIIGLIMFGYILTALGTLFSTERVMSLVVVVLAVFFGIGLLATIDPHTTIAAVAKFIPLITPFAMVSLTTSLPSLPIYLTVLVIVIAFLWIVRSLLGRLFVKGILLEVVPGRIHRLIRMLMTQS